MAHSKNPVSLNLSHVVTFVFYSHSQSNFHKKIWQNVLCVLRSQRYCCDHKNTGPLLTLLTEEIQLFHVGPLISKSHVVTFFYSHSQSKPKNMVEGYVYYVLSAIAVIMMAGPILKGMRLTMDFLSSFDTSQRRCSSFLMAHPISLNLSHVVTFF